MKYHFILGLGLFLSLCSCANKQDKPVSRHESKLTALFRPASEAYPIISVHRGGKGLRNYPENCIETMSYIKDSINAMFEVDVAETKDGKLVLMHDRSVTRTTTGQGLVNGLNYNDLKSFYLVDDFGNVTPYRVPLFTDVLEWAKRQNIILSVDIKRSTTQSKVIKAIEKAKAEDYCILITYTLQQAKHAHGLAPGLLLSVPARNETELKRLLQAEIPVHQMVAFTGTRLSRKSLYTSIVSYDMLPMLGTLGNLDQRAQARGDHLYRKWMDLGVRIFATDRPFEAYQAVNSANQK